ESRFMAVAPYLMAVPFRDTCQRPHLVGALARPHDRREWHEGSGQSLEAATDERRRQASHVVPSRSRAKACRPLTALRLPIAPADDVSVEHTARAMAAMAANAHMVAFTDLSLGVWHARVDAPQPFACWAAVKPSGKVKSAAAAAAPARRERTARGARVGRISRWWYDDWQCALSSRVGVAAMPVRMDW